MSPVLLSHNSIRRLLPWLTPAAVLCAITGLYIWSEPSRKSASGPVTTVASARVGIHLENAPFAAYSDGSKSWSLWAKSIDLEHPQYSSAASIESASITDIRDGMLYGASSPIPGQRGTSPAQHWTSGSDNAKFATPSTTPSVRFHAKSGHYYVGASQSLPGDLTANYAAQWQLQLNGDVSVTTRDGNSLHTESLTILELTNLRNKGTEQRLVCDAGATISRRDVKIETNRMRYSLNDHTVELMNGVRGAFKDGSMQAERAFWSLQDDVVQIPDPSTGTLDGNRFSAESLVLDMKNGRQLANRFHIHFRKDLDRKEQ